MKTLQDQVEASSRDVIQTPEVCVFCRAASDTLFRDNVSAQRQPTSEKRPGILLQWIGKAEPQYVPDKHCNGRQGNPHCWALVGEDVHSIDDKILRRLRLLGPRQVFGSRGVMDGNAHGG
ncbi:hypothetical protein DL546_000093 [Coniochaeta pulveracea]|uniref:Uncharacterized protein n=1 Tax=Coniochaeta pulveracea TaxID=177199 RepID=A0A420XW52_9PEZI|nr:hypothetical protein DL546_000093 [Coniochaeta pulveracea]